MLGWLFLIGSIVGAWHSLNALRPAQPRRGIGPLWLPALLTGELVPLHFAWQGVLTALFLWGGAGSTVPGKVALVLTGISWLGMGALVIRARGAERVMDEALAEALGDDFETRLGPEARRWIETVPKPRLFWRTLDVPADVEVVSGVSYGPHPRQEVDFYLPRSGAVGAPVLVQIHGGSWMRGRRDRQARPLLYHLAATGWVCVAVGYRVSPEATFPEHLIDLKLALAWLKRRARDRGWNGDFVAVTGGSAGGHLAAMLALTANHPEYQPGFPDEDTSVAACIPLYGIFDLVRRDGVTPLWPLLRHHVMKSTATSDPEAWRSAAPIHQALDGAPPFLVLHGASDSLVRPAGSRRFVTALRAASDRPVGFAEIPGGTHGFDYFATPRAYAAVRGISTFLGFVYSYRAELGDRATRRDQEDGRSVGQ